MRNVTAPRWSDRVLDDPGHHGHHGPLDPLDAIRALDDERAFLLAALLDALDADQRLALAVTMTWLCRARPLSAPDAPPPPAPPGA